MNVQFKKNNNSNEDKDVFLMDVSEISIDFNLISLKGKIYIFSILGLICA